jgi:hypothetical protein
VNVRLIVPRRADGGHRDRLWDFCRAYWQMHRPAWEVIEGHHDDGPFNRSAAINRAAEGEWDVAVILDSDTIVDVDLVEEGIARAHACGRLVLPFDVRCLLDRQGTEKVLAGHRGPWDRFIRHRQTPTDAYVYISGAQCVPRRLWDDVGGFDERFEGWGGEDDAFHAACMALAGQDPRRDRLKGKAWHLWHRTSRYASHRQPTWKMAKALSDRYIAAAEDWEQMRALLLEDRGADQVVVVCLTTGERDTLEATLESAERNLRGPIGRRVICVDRPDTDVERDGWDVIAMGVPRGYVTATRHAQAHAIGSGQPWVFWLEDDFTFNRVIDLCQMQALMEAHPELAQMSLMRQAWYEHELAAGGIIAAKPQAFHQRDGYVEHRAYWTSNPMLVRREFLAANEWPDGAGSEQRFARTVFRDPKSCAGILGRIEDPPRVTHQGQVRAGHGY